jgi:predicted nucleotidyltransferase
MMEARLPLKNSVVAEFCRRHRVRRLAVFGSFMKGTARPESDIDVLAEFEAGARPTLFDVADMEQELSTLLGGRRVDIRTLGDLSRYFRSDVLREAEVQFESP